MHLADCFETLNDLTQKVSRFLFKEPSSYFSESVEISSVAILHKQIKVVDCFLNVEEADDVWVLDSAKYAYFVFEILLESLVKIDFLDNFASHPFFELAIFSKLC